jgi:hypothetical protein
MQVRTAHYVIMFSQSCAVYVSYWCAFSFQSLQACPTHGIAAVPAKMCRYASHCAYYSTPTVDTAYINTQQEEEEA